MPGLDRIENIVVLMQENRSFDHFLGYLYPGNVTPNGQPFEGVAGNPTSIGVDGKPVPVFPITPATPNAYFMPGADPGEGYAATNWQLFGPQASQNPPVPPDANNSGYITNFASTLQWESRKPTWMPLPGTVPNDIMGVYTPEALPVLSGLAKGYAVSDMWFASLPTQTIPNRAFLHAGTSQGRMDDRVKNFTCPTIFGAMSKVKGTPVSWKIYGYDAMPLTRLTFSDTAAAPAGNFGLFKDFQADAAAGKLPQYTFLEPSWGSTGNSQHPNYNVALGEKLLMDVYQTLRQSPQWHKTLFIITFDEHGGIFDHVAPPTGATPPDSTAGEFGFDFKRFGVRIPTVFVSPLIEPGIVFRAPAGGPPFDHTSMLKMLENRFGIAPLTARDAAAPDISDVVTLTTPRTDDPLAGVQVPSVRTANLYGPSAGLPAHLQQVEAGLVRQLVGERRLPALRTDVDYRNYINSRMRDFDRGVTGRDRGGLGL